MITGFLADSKAIHEDYGYVVDDVFPGEYITMENVDDAIAGRGFSVSESGRLYLPKASNEYYKSSRETYYRAWRSMLAFSKKLYGDKSKFQESKLGAWESILLYLIRSRELSIVTT